jgi:hypothetical protein
MRLHIADGTRKYLTAGERDAFPREAERADRTVRTPCMTMAYAGGADGEPCQHAHNAALRPAARRNEPR